MKRQTSGSGLTIRALLLAMVATTIIEFWTQHSDRTYRKLLPFFLGLILGDFFMGGFWGVVGWFSDRPGYIFFP